MVLRGRASIQGCKKKYIQESQKGILIFVNKKWAASTWRLQKSLYIKKKKSSSSLVRGLLELRGVATCKACSNLLLEDPLLSTSLLLFYGSTPLGAQSMVLWYGDNKKSLRRRLQQGVATGGERDVGEGGEKINKYNKVFASEVQESDDEKSGREKRDRDGREVGHVQMDQIATVYLQRTELALQSSLFSDHHLTLITTRAFREMLT